MDLRSYKKPFKEEISQRPGYRTQTLKANKAARPETPIAVQSISDAHSMQAEAIQE